MRLGPRGILCVLVLRALSLLVFAELSGLSHTALDLSGSEHADDDCEDHECTPGCPSCHCWHAGLASPQLPATVEPPRVLLRSPEAAPPAYTRTQPRAPDQSTLYRPPRTLA